jgi:hypothetical protein
MVNRVLRESSCFGSFVFWNPNDWDSRRIKNEPSILNFQSGRSQLARMAKEAKLHSQIQESSESGGSFGVCRAVDKEIITMGPN